MLFISVFSDKEFSIPTYDKQIISRSEDVKYDFEFDNVNSVSVKITVDENVEENYPIFMGNEGTVKLDIVFPFYFKKAVKGDIDVTNLSFVVDGEEKNVVDLIKEKSEYDILSAVLSSNSSVALLPANGGLIVTDIDSDQISLEIFEQILFEAMMVDPTLMDFLDVLQVTNVSPSPENVSEIDLNNLPSLSEETSSLTLSSMIENVFDMSYQGEFVYENVDVKPTGYVVGPIIGVVLLVSLIALTRQR